MNEWISVKQQYPKLVQGVLVSDGIVVGFALWHPGLLKWVQVDQPWKKFNCEVTHWTTLPNPPKE